MRRRFGVALVILSAIGSRASADSTSIGNYGAWQILSSPSKTAYAAGAFDMLALPSSGTVEDNADAIGLATCARADGFNPRMLADLVDRRYVVHSDEWG